MVTENRWQASRAVCGDWHCRTADTYLRHEIVLHTSRSGILKIGKKIGLYSFAKNSKGPLLFNDVFGALKSICGVNFFF